MDIKTASNLNAVFLENFEKYSDKAAMSFRENGQYKSLTYRQLKAKVLRVVNYLVHVGLQPNDRTLLWSTARPDWIWVDMGVLMAGGVSVALSPKQDIDAVLKAVNDLQAKFLFVENQAQLDLVKGIKSQAPSLKLVFVLDEVSSPEEWVVPFDWLFEFSTKAEGMGVLYKMIEEKNRDSLLTVVYSQAKPMGISYSHGTCLDMVSGVTEFFGPHFNDIQKNLCFLAPSNGFARFADYYLMLLSGRCIVFAGSESTAFREFKTVKPEVVFAKPSFIASLYKNKEQEMNDASFLKKAVFNWSVKKGQKASEIILGGQALGGMTRMSHRLANMLVYKKIKKEFGGRLRFFISGGEPLEAEVVQFFHALGITVLDTFGTPEVAFAATVNLPSKMRVGSVGQVLPDTDVRIASGSEIQMKGRGLFSGYYNSPQETQAAFTDDGFFRTGRCGHIDAQGYLFVTGEM